MCGNHTCSGTECTAADKRHCPALSEGETWMTPITGRTYKVLHMSNGDIGGWIWLCYSSMHYPPMGGKKINSSGVKAAVRWQLAQRGAQGSHPSVSFVRFPEGQSSAALHVAAVLFTSPRKPITSPRCCASQSRCISHTDSCGRALTQMPRAHPHTQTNTCSSNSSWPRYKAWIMPFDLSVVKYIDVRTRSDYLQLRRIMRQVSERMKNDGLFTMGFLYWGWMRVDYKPVFIIWKMERHC